MAAHDTEALPGTSATRDDASAVVDRLVVAANPATVIVVGGGQDDVVDAFAARGIDARGVEPGEPIEGRVDLVTCLGVLETLRAAQAQDVVDKVCAAADRVLFCSTVAGYADPVHVNVQPLATWAQAFAQRGFFRRPDVNLDFLGPGAVLYEKTDVDRAALVHRYESLLAPASAEAHGKASALLEAHRTIASLRDEITTLKLGGPDPDKVGRLTAELATLHDEVSQSRYDQLTVRDHIIGLEAENERLTGELDRARARVSSQRSRIENVTKKLRSQQRNTRKLRREVEEVRKRLVGQRQLAQARAREVAELRSSRTWKVGRALVRPASLFRR